MYYEYTQLDGGDNIRRVTRAVTCAGQHTHTIAYTVSSHGAGAGANNWYLKAVADRDDGAQKIGFTNYYRQVMLTDLWDTPGDQSAGRWICYTTYEETCYCPVELYTPAAIDTNVSLVYDEAAADLDVAVKLADGLVCVKTYYISGDCACTFEYEQVKQGANGTPINIRKHECTKHTIGSAPEETTIVLPAALTEYRSASGGGSDPVTTTYAYTFHPSTVQVLKKTTTLPQIPTSQNGQGDNPVSDPLYTIDGTYDTQGRPTDITDPYDSNDPPSYIPHTSTTYDEPTGSPIQEVQNPYSGTPPSPNEYNLTTDY